MKVKSSEYKLLTGLFFRLLPYQILLIVINAVNGIIDSIYASNFIGITAMGAIGLFGPMTHFLYAAGMLFVSGSQILYGRYLARERSRINGLFTVNILISLGLSLLTSILLVIAVFTGGTRLLVSQEPDLTMLNQYILGQAIGIPALIVGQQLFSFLSLENQTKRTMAATITCLIVNAVFDHVFIVLFPMGTFGLGLSTSVSNWLFLLILAMYYIMGKSEWKFDIRNPGWGDAPQIVRLGYPGALARFVEMFRTLIVNYLIIIYVGMDGLSAYAASNSLMALFWPVPFGMMAVERMLYSISVGEQDRRSLVNVTRIVFTKGMILMACIVAILVVFADPFTRMFYQDPTQPVYDMTAMAFRIVPFCMPTSLISLTFSCLAQTVERKKLALIIPIIDGALDVTVCSIILIPILKMKGLYISSIINGVICMIVIVVSACIETKRFPKCLEDLMAIPGNIGVDEDERIDITVRTMDEVLDVSKRIIEFCKAKGINRRTGYFAGLCMEEMAGNVVKHGFKSGSRKNSCDIRVINSASGLIMRIRDNCAGFDPLERSKVMEATGDGGNIGIKLVYKIARQVDYQNLLGMNVLTIHFDEDGSKDKV